MCESWSVSILAQIYYSMASEDTQTYGHPNHRDPNRISAFLSRVSAGQVPFTHVVAWYYPSRYTRWVQKLLDNATDTQLNMMVGFVAFSFVLFSVVGLYVYNSASGSGPVPVDKKPKAA